MTKIQYVLILVLISLSSTGFAQNRCSDAFNSNPSVSISAKRIEAQFAPGFPEASRAAIVEILDRVSVVAGSLKLPSKISFTHKQQGNYEVGSADPIKGEIAIINEAFHLSPQSFEAVVAHEITHLIVTQNFHIAGTKKTLHQALQDLRHDTYEAKMIEAQHTKFAELLCDTMAVIVTSNPKAQVQLFDELMKINPSFAKAKDPSELGRRDFSISPDHQGWETYEPNDFIYNVMNQLRSWVWHRWLKTLTAEKRPEFFAKLVKALDPIYGSGGYDLLLTNGVAEANQQMVDYLEATLESQQAP